MFRRISSAAGFSYALMVLLVFVWGFEYIAAKNSLEVIKPLTLVFFKYSTAFLVVFSVKIISNRKFTLKRRDIAFFAVCALFGDVLYYGGEYSAMDYLPVSVITIILAFVPALSIVLEFCIYHRKPSVLIVLGILVSILGVAMVVLSDIRELLNGRIIGYLFAFSAVICWNVYNFMTDRLTSKYGAVEITLYQIISAVLISAPYALSHLPAAADVTPDLIWSLLYVGGISSGVGFLIYVRSINIIGVTPTALFSNALPLTTTFFGFLFLHEAITPLQYVGGIVVILSGSMVILLKSKHDAKNSISLPDAKGD
ncbi:MAG: DMT family transporter [Clostridiales Family XIII bacterium]|jgi:drug/metabolite transporter (DMT)-like permease|nr:DMT family transporter [Clostridiales Family XIII bacterium]